MKRDAKGNSNREPKHVRLYDWMMECRAWKDLSANARAVYIMLKRRYNGTNNGKLGLSARQAGEELHISKNTAASALQELRAHGFIEVSIAGSFGQRKDGRATEYRLTELPCDRTKSIPSKLFMRWQPGEDFSGPCGVTAGPCGVTAGPSYGTARRTYS